MTTIPARLRTTIDGRPTELPVLRHHGLPLVQCTQILRSTQDAARLAWGPSALLGYPGDRTAPAGRQVVGYVTAHATGAACPVTLPEGEDGAIRSVG